MQSGDHVKAIERQARRRKDKATVERLNRDTEGDFDDRELILYVNLFVLCEADRHGPLMPIPLTSMLTCVSAFELDGYQSDFLLATFAIADPIVLADRRTRANGNTPATGN